MTYRMSTSRSFQDMSRCFIMINDMFFNFDVRMYDLED